MVTMESTKTIEILQRHPLFEALSFVVGARDKEGTRPILTCVKVETKDGKQFVYAADGYHLHMADITNKIGKFDTGLVDGLYNVIKATQPRVILEPASDVGTYPNIWLLIPDYPLLTAIVDSRGGWEHAASSAYTKVVRAMGKGSIPFDQFKLLEPGNIDHTWKFYFKDATSPLVFKSENQHENLTAVIMPLYCE